jgi:flagellar basal-body rod modification protein FlgD
MSTDAISSYLTTYNASTTNSASNSTESDGNTLSMDDFITLLVAQLQNQDMNNTTDTSEMMSQMAQYSMVQAMTDMKAQSVVASSFGLIGKGVTITSTSDSGTSTTINGEVDGVTLTDGVAKVVVNKTAYSIDDITAVFDASLLDSE